MEGSYDGSFQANVQSPLTPSITSPTDSPTTAFKTNLNRKKTQKWVEAKIQSYDGDDWGNDFDDDEDNEPVPPPLPKPRDQNSFLSVQPPPMPSVVMQPSPSPLSSSSQLSAPPIRPLGDLPPLQTQFTTASPDASIVNPHESAAPPDAAASGLAKDPQVDAEPVPGRPQPPSVPQSEGTATGILLNTLPKDQPVVPLEPRAIATSETSTQAYEPPQPDNKHLDPEEREPASPAGATGLDISLGHGSNPLKSALTKSLTSSPPPLEIPASISTIDAPSHTATPRQSALVTTSIEAPTVEKSAATPSSVPPSSSPVQRTTSPEPGSVEKSPASDTAESSPLSRETTTIPDLDTGVVLPTQPSSSSTVAPTAPLQPRPVDISPTDFTAPPLLHRQSTFSTSTSSPAKESDRLREEIMQSLSPVRPAADYGQWPAQQESIRDSRVMGGTRESTYLPSLYDDYWAATAEDAQGNLQGTVDEAPNDAAVGTEDAAVPPVSPDRGPSGSAQAEPPVLAAIVEPTPSNTTPSPSTSSIALQEVTPKPKRFSWEVEPDEASMVRAMEPTSVPDGVQLLEPGAQPLAASLGFSAQEPLLPEHNIASDIPSPLGPASSVSGPTDVRRSPSFPGTEPHSPTPATPNLSTKEPPNQLSLVEERTSAQEPEPGVASPTATTDRPALSPTQISDPSSTSPRGLGDSQGLPTTIMKFRDILLLPDIKERITKYDETRAQFAAMDSGLNEWLLAVQSRHPEHASVTAPFLTPVAPRLMNEAAIPTSSGPASSQQPPQPVVDARPAVQQPYYQQYLNASNPALGAPSANRPHMMNQPHADLFSNASSDFKYSGNQMGAKGKGLLLAAGKAGKGLLSKGKNKLRGSSEKTDTPTVYPPKTKADRRTSWGVGFGSKLPIESDSRPNSSAAGPPDKIRESAAHTAGSAALPLQQAPQYMHQPSNLQQQQQQRQHLQEYKPGSQPYQQPARPHPDVHAPPNLQLKSPAPLSSTHPNLQSISPPPPQGNPYALGPTSAALLPRSNEAPELNSPSVPAVPAVKKVQDASCYSQQWDSAERLPLSNSQNGASPLTSPPQAVDSLFIEPQTSSIPVQRIPNVDKQADSRQGQPHLAPGAPGAPVQLGLSGPWTAEASSQQYPSPAGGDVTSMESEIVQRHKSFIGLPPIRRSSTFGASLGLSSDELSLAGGPSDGTTAIPPIPAMPGPEFIAYHTRLDPSSSRAYSPAVTGPATSPLLVRGEMRDRTESEGVPAPPSLRPRDVLDTAGKGIAPSLSPISSHSGAFTPTPNGNPIQKFPPTGQWNLQESHLSEPLLSAGRNRPVSASSQTPYIGFDKETGLSGEAVDRLNNDSSDDDEEGTGASSSRGVTREGPISPPPLHPSVPSPKDQNAILTTASQASPALARHPTPDATSFSVTPRPDERNPPNPSDHPFSRPPQQQLVGIRPLSRPETAGGQTPKAPPSQSRDGAENKRNSGMFSQIGDRFYRPADSRPSTNESRRQSITPGDGVSESSVAVEGFGEKKKRRSSFLLSLRPSRPGSEEDSLGNSAQASGQPLEAPPLSPSAKVKSFLGAAGARPSPGPSKLKKGITRASTSDVAGEPGHSRLPSESSKNRFPVISNVLRRSGGNPDQSSRPDALPHPAAQSQMQDRPMSGTTPGRLPGHSFPPSQPNRAESTSSAQRMQYLMSPAHQNVPSPEDDRGGRPSSGGGFLSNIFHNRSPSKSRDMLQKAQDPSEPTSRNFMQQQAQVGPLGPRPIRPDSPSSLRQQWHPVTSPSNQHAPGSPMNPMTGPPPSRLQDQVTSGAGRQIIRLVGATGQGPPLATPPAPAPGPSSQRSPHRQGLSQSSPDWEREPPRQPTALPTLDPRAAQSPPLPVQGLGLQLPPDQSSMPRIESPPLVSQVGPVSTVYSNPSAMKSSQRVPASSPLGSPSSVGDSTLHRSPPTSDLDVGAQRPTSHQSASTRSVSQASPGLGIVQPAVMGQNVGDTPETRVQSLTGSPHSSQQRNSEAEQQTTASTDGMLSNRMSHQTTSSVLSATVEGAMLSKQGPSAHAAASPPNFARHSNGSPQPIMMSSPHQPMTGHPTPRVVSSPQVLVGPSSLLSVGAPAPQRHATVAAPNTAMPLIQQIPQQASTDGVAPPQSRESAGSGMSKWFKGRSSVQGMPQSLQPVKIQEGGGSPGKSLFGVFKRGSKQVDVKTESWPQGGVQAPAPGNTAPYGQNHDDVPGRPRQYSSPGPYPQGQMMNPLGPMPSGMVPSNSQTFGQAGIPGPHQYPPGQYPHFPNQLGFMPAQGAGHPMYPAQGRVVMSYPPQLPRGSVQGFVDPRYGQFPRPQDPHGYRTAYGGEGSGPQNAYNSMPGGFAPPGQYHPQQQGYGMAAPGSKSPQRAADIYSPQPERQGSTMVQGMQHPSSTAKQWNSVNSPDMQAAPSLHQVPSSTTVAAPGENLGLPATRASPTEGNEGTKAVTTESSRDIDRGDNAASPVGSQALSDKPLAGTEHSPVISVLADSASDKPVTMMGSWSEGARPKQPDVPKTDEVEETSMSGPAGPGPSTLNRAEEERARLLRIAQEEKIVVGEVDEPPVRAVEELDTPKMSATSYPGQEWNPYTMGFYDDVDVRDDWK